MEVTVYSLNAFTKDNQGGNQAGVVLDADQLHDTQMQTIAAAVGASETAFILHSKTATKRIRFFTPTTEVDICGHATIASWSLLYDKGFYRAGSYSMEILAGTIDIVIGDDGFIFMQQPVPQFQAVHNPEEVASILGIETNDIVNLPIQSINGNLMVGLQNKQLLNSLAFDMPKLAAYSLKHNCHSVHVFVLNPRENILAAVRDFCPAVGIPEDAATGSGNGALLAYLRHYTQLAKQDRYVFEQGEAMGSLSELHGKIVTDRVWIGGQASQPKRLQIAVAN